MAKYGLPKGVEPTVKPVEGGVCLYKDGESKVFTKGEATEALSDGWKDEPVAKKQRGRPRKEEEA